MGNLKFNIYLIYFLIYQKIFDVMKNSEITKTEDIVEKITFLLCYLLKNLQEYDKIKIYMNTFFTKNKENLELKNFRENFLENFCIINYAEQDKRQFNKVIYEKFKDSLEDMKNGFILCDPDTTGFISFINFRSILEKSNINLDYELIEYVIYLM